MNKKNVLSQTQIENRIFTVRGVHVMLDSDLAEMYRVETRMLNQAVKRNIERFPDDFMFQVTESEWEILRSQNGILRFEAPLRSQNAALRSTHGKHRKYLPSVFTEQGVAGLSGVLKSEFLLSRYLCAAVLCVTVSLAANCGDKYKGHPAVGMFTDSRDSTTYKTVKIGAQTWMSENLNYETGESWCYDNDSSNCAKYGRLYNWNTAMKACPAGWHLPSDKEWRELITAAGGEGGAGAKLKSAAGWNENGNGTDELGFSALAGGSRKSDGVFGDIGGYGLWWCANEDSAGKAQDWGIHVLRPRSGGGKAFNRGIFGKFRYVAGNWDYKGGGHSVRCLKD